MHFSNLGVGFLSGMLGWRKPGNSVVLMEFVRRIGRAPYKNPAIGRNPGSPPHQGKPGKIEMISAQCQNPNVEMNLER